MIKLIGVAAVCTWAFFGAVPSASAQSDFFPSFKEAVASGVLRALYVSTPIVQAVDGFSTMKVVQLGGREQNPLMAPIVSSPAAFAATRATIAFGEIYMAHGLAKHNRFLAIGALAGLNVAYALFAAHNFKVANTLQRQRAGHP
jgi:hypothetical protein